MSKLEKCSRFFSTPLVQNAYGYIKALRILAKEIPLYLLCKTWYFPDLVLHNTPSPNPHFVTWYPVLLLNEIFQILFWKHRWQDTAFICVLIFPFLIIIVLHLLQAFLKVNWNRSGVITLLKWIIYMHARKYYYYLNIYFLPELWSNPQIAASL